MSLVAVVEAIEKSLAMSLPESYKRGDAMPMPDCDGLRFASARFCAIGAQRWVSGTTSTPRPDGLIALSIAIGCNGERFDLVHWQHRYRPDIKDDYAEPCSRVEDMPAAIARLCERVRPVLIGDLLPVLLGDEWPDVPFEWGDYR